MKNIVGVRPKESVDVTTIGYKDFKCTQCTFRKQTRGAVESHMYDTHGICGFECMFCDFTTTNSYSLYVHCNSYRETNIKGLKLKI